MNKEQQMVREFHQAFGVVVNEKPSNIPETVRNLRTDLISEELDELFEAQLADDLVAVADALADLLYVVYGAAVSYGIDLEPVFAEVHRSNMSKVFPDGKVHKRADGKVLKPENYSPADVRSIIEKQKSGVRSQETE